MTHKTFRYVSLVSFIMIFALGVVYNYFIVNKPSELRYRFGLKPIPIMILIIDVVIYFVIYRIHVYALLIQIGFLFCLLGDILLMFYIPTIPEYDNSIFLVAGGTSFFIARVVMSLAFGAYPYTAKKAVLIGIIPFIYTTYLIIWFSINMENTAMTVLLSFYIVMMGIQLFLSLLRINGVKHESLVAQILGVLGTVSFTISDTLLFWNIFLKPISYGNIISISLYWIGMYLLMVSIIRYRDFTHEKSNSILYLQLSNH